MKNNLDYYIRYTTAHQHLKFKMLRSKFGWEGDGRFWALNDMIAGSDNCLLDFNKPYLEGAVASELGMQLEEFKNFFSYLVNDCNLVQEPETGKFTTEIVQEIFQKVEADRIAARERKTKKGVVPRTFEKFGELPRTSEKFDRTEQESKVKESKVKESIIIRSDGDDPDLDKIKKLFITTWQRIPKNYSETLAVEKMLCEYSEKHIVQAFRRAAEMDKMNVAYVRGILKKHYEDLAKNKAKQDAAIQKAETIKAAQTTDLIKPGSLTGTTTNKYLQEAPEPIKRRPVVDIDKNSPDYKRKLSLMNQQIDQEIKKGA